MSMSADAIYAVAHGSYFNAIARALDDPGKSATIDSSGRPSSRPAVVVSFSSQAQLAMADRDIALKLMNASRVGAIAAPVSKQTQSPQSSAPVAITTAEIASTTTTPSDTAPTDAALHSTTASVEELAAEARASLTDPEAVFKAVADERGQDWNRLLVFQGEADQKAFEAAYASGRVTYQNASDIEGLNYQDHTTISGFGESNYVTYDVDWRVRREAETGQYTNMLCFPIVGAVFMSYPKLPDATEGDATQAAAPA